MLKILIIVSIAAGIKKTHYISQDYIFVEVYDENEQVREVVFFDMEKKIEYKFDSTLSIGCYRQWTNDQFENLGGWNSQAFYKTEKRVSDQHFQYMGMECIEVTDVNFRKGYTDPNKSVSNSTISVYCKIPVLDEYIQGRNNNYCPRLLKNFSEIQQDKYPWLVHSYLVGLEGVPIDIGRIVKIKEQKVGKDFFERFLHLQTKVNCE